MFLAHVTNITLLQSSHSSGSASDFEYSKKIKVADMLLHLDQIKHTFNNKLQVYNYLLDVINVFKLKNIAALNVARHQLYELLQEHFEIIMSFINFSPSSYKTEEHPNEAAEYDLEISFILHGLTETDIAMLSEDHNVEEPSVLYTSQWLDNTDCSVIVRIPNNKLNICALPPQPYIKPHVRTAQTQTISQALN